MNKVERGRKGHLRPGIACAKVLWQVGAHRGQGLPVRGCGWSKEQRKADPEKVKTAEGDRTLGPCCGSLGGFEAGEA